MLLRMARLCQCVLDECPVRLIGLGDIEVRLRDDFDASGARMALISRILPGLLLARTSCFIRLNLNAETQRTRRNTRKTSTRVN